ncbi:MAG: twin-arginine translocase subunit TatC [Planctomycetaceae bacterium]|nr:twin-arginine translocase subunit TatC [Planctomycetaceae bacterium]
MPNSRDLFDDSTMSFGDHLEALRVHLFKSVIGLVISVCVMLFFADHMIHIIRRPIDKALREHHKNLAIESEELEKSALDWWNEIWSGDFFKSIEEEEPTGLTRSEIQVTITRQELARVVRELDPDAKITFDQLSPPNTETPDSDNGESPAEEESTQESGNAESLPDVKLIMKSPAFRDLQQSIDQLNQPITLNVQEAFMIYLKVAIVSGLVIAFPWIAYQMWLFVAAGLYEHEKRYVYIFLPTSMFLFLSGAVFCYFGVFPFVLDFLLGFNKDIGVTPQIRLSEWISFALVLPVMFGLSFQLPLVMYFVERMGFIKAETYREKRRLAILIIATLSMFLTPADPMSMIMMMIPLMLLYELGIYFCRLNPAINPYEAE